MGAYEAADKHGVGADEGVGTYVESAHVLCAGRSLHPRPSDSDAEGVGVDESVVTYVEFAHAFYAPNVSVLL